MAEEEGRDQVSEVTSTSWLGRIGQSFGGVVFGFILIALSGALLFWNEGRAIQAARSLSEGAGLVQTVSADRVDPANEGKLVHVMGALAASGPAVDGEFGLRSTGGLRIVRRVEMFQWTEESESKTEKKLGGSEEKTTVYKYAKAWSEQAVDSAKFRERAGHANPQMTYRSRATLAPQLRLGAFTVPDRLLQGFGGAQALAATDEQAAALQKRLNKPVAAVDGVLYIGRDPGQPAVGDYKISFMDVRLQPASIVARQAGPTFEAYRTKAGGSVELIVAGQVPAADMFKEAQDDNRIWTWLLRAGGCVAMFIGFSLILGPLGVLGDVIPILGDVIRAGTFLVGLLCTATIAPVIIAIGWLWYRPVVAIGTLALGGIVVYGVLRLVRRRAARKVAPA